MIEKDLFKYIDKDKVICSLNAPAVGTKYVKLIRIIADENKLLIKDNEKYPVIDVDTLDGWYEIDVPTEELAKAIN